MSLTREEKIALKLRGIPVACRNCVNWKGARTIRTDACEKGYRIKDRLKLLRKRSQCPDFQLKEDILRNGDPLAGAKIP